MKIKLLIIFSCLFFINSVLSQTRVPRKVLVEYYDGAWNPNGPDGRVFMDSLINSYPNLLTATIYSVSNGSLLTSNSAPLSNVFGTFIPSAVFDRSTNFGIARQNWQSSAASRIGLTSPLEILLNKQINGNSVSITATINIKDTLLPNINAGISLYVIEDSIVGSGAGYDQTNSYNTVLGHPYYGAGNPIVGYMHKRFVRLILPSSNTFGDFSVIPLNPATVSSYSKTFNVVMDSTWNLNQVSFIAIVAYKNGNSFYEVVNAEEIRYNQTTTGLTSDKNMAEVGFNIFPNPARSYINLQLNETEKEARFEVFDINGKTVCSRNFNNQINNRLDLTTFNDGIYFVKIISSKGVGLKKFIVR
jgi:hypothetical protein